MYKKRLILWSIISFLSFTLAIEGNTAIAGDERRPAVGDKRFRAAAGGAGSDEANMEAVAALAPAAPSPGTVTLPLEAAAKGPPTLIQQALEIINGILALKKMDPYLLGEAPADAPPPDFTKWLDKEWWKGLLGEVSEEDFSSYFKKWEIFKRHLHFFYSEVEEYRIRAFQQAIQEPLFNALKLFARVTHDHPQTFANISWLHPLGSFMAFDTFNSPDALNNLKLLFLKVEEIGKEIEKTEQLKKEKKPSNSQPSKKIDPKIRKKLEDERDKLLADKTFPVNYFAQYVEDLQRLKLAEEAFKTVEIAEPSTFSGRLSILRSLQVIGEHFKNFSSIIMVHIGSKTRETFVALRDLFVHFNKRRFDLIADDENAERFNKIKREIQDFEARFLEISDLRKSIEKERTPAMIWKALTAEADPSTHIDPLERREAEWPNIEGLMDSWNEGGKTPKLPLLTKVDNLLEILKVTKTLAGIETDCVLEEEKAAWAEITRGKLFIMQSVWQQVQTPMLKPSELEALNTALPATSRETLRKDLYSTAYPGDPAVDAANEFAKATSRVEFDEAMARFGAILEEFITHMEANAHSLGLLGIDVPGISAALREGSRARRSVALRVREIERYLSEDPWEINPPKFLIQHLADPKKAVEPWPIPPTETPTMRASRRAALEGLLPIICRQAIETLGTELPILSDLRKLGNYYAHPQPGYRDKPYLGFSRYSEPTQALAQDVGFLTLNLYHILQRFRDKLIADAVTSGSAVAGAASGGGFSTTMVAMDEEL